MTLIPMLIALAAALLLLGAGYLYGARRGSNARERLRAINLQQVEQLKQLQRFSERDDRRESSLRKTIEQVLGPLVERETFSLGLSDLADGAGQHRDLTLMLDRIQEIGHFSAVMISNEEGLPLAADSGARQDVERLAAVSSLMLLMTERIAGPDRPAPRSIMVHDESNVTTLCRIFRVRDQRLSLTAVSEGARLTPTALDPALTRIEALLSPS